MDTKETAVVLLAAGLGTRMNSILPKVLHPIAGRAMILQLLDSLTDIDPDRIVLVIGPDMGLVSDAMAAAGYDFEVVIQHDRLGTGHAVQQTEKVLSDFKGNVLVLYGDSPLITSKTLVKMLDARAIQRNPAVVVLGFRPFDASEYGRLIVDNAILKCPADRPSHDRPSSFCVTFL